jgi:pilus assembly protein Flp/PilA
MFATLVTLLQNVKNDRKAVTAMEYGLIASLVAVVIITTVTTLGGRLNNIFSTVSAAL